MIICGIKLSHDGGVAVIADRQLVFSIEMEKINNNRRYCEIGDLRDIGAILSGEGIDPKAVDRFVIDGWWTVNAQGAPAIAARQNGADLAVPVGPYVPDEARGGLLRPAAFPGVPGGPLGQGYLSYSHASGHAFASYCTSPFAAAGEAALVLTYDGGMLPRLYHITQAPVSVSYIGPLFPLIGNVFTELCKDLEPFSREYYSLAGLERAFRMLEIPGKAMAYAGLGQADSRTFPVFQKLFGEMDPAAFGAAIGDIVSARKHELFEGLSSADLIASLQDYLGELLVRNLVDVAASGAYGALPNLCLSGGCALNIKWNSMLRDSDTFAGVWVPPFPNDSGAAIGAACCELARDGTHGALSWNVYSGPPLRPSAAAPGWTARPCSEQEVASIMDQENEPVVVLDGRAELGPRALGNRSILAPATDAAMKDRLNDIKGRANYRPVAPICLESEAGQVFVPGQRDPYMLFEHCLRPGWSARIPAIMHLDGTARLQTINPDTAGSAAGRILREYWRRSGIPVLCNTSANLAGRGFFPDVAAATEWAGASYVWSGGVLYTNSQARPQRGSARSESR